MPDPLDRPVWSALNSGWAKLAEGDGRAWRLPPDHGPFAAAADRSPANMMALAALIPPGGELWTVESEPSAWPAAIGVVREASCVQMVAQDVAGPDAPGIEPLNEADAEAMIALATLTVPGPFVRHTNRLSQFLGIKHDGALIAMAGERMRLPGHAEVSGVCTHPDFRGQGLAAGLIRAVSRRILTRGELPILHSYASNLGANGLYERLGFATRRIITMTVIRTI